MKVLLFALTILFIGATSSADDKLKCNTLASEIPDEWVDMADKCILKMRQQVQMELEAAMTYLAMGAHFSRDVINRPGFSEFFFKAASEEREHAIKVISYLLMRGELTGDISKLIENPKPRMTTWTSGVDALKKALNLETEVTTSIRNIMTICESSPNKKTADYNDFHLVDYLTGDFLEEQLHGQRDLAGKISTLDKMMKDHGALGEFMFDKKLLGELA